MRLLQLWVASVLLLSACESITEQPETVAMGASLQGVTVKPDSVSTTAAGSFSGTLSSEETFTYTISFSGLTSAATGAHLHGPADTSGVAPILVDLANLPVGSTGTIALGAVVGTGEGLLDLALPVNTFLSGDSLHALLRAGRVYVDVHTANHGAGEIRGQLGKN
ncbi:MAG: CHRD domain-containing protein [Gemmatimonadaceae bacterium]